MSVNMIRLSLTHLCTIERNASAGAWGDTDAPDWQQHLADQPCRLWVTAGLEQVDATSSVVSEDMRMLLPLGTDVTEQDRIATVAERGATIAAGPIGIRAVLQHADHLELILVRLS